MDQLRERFLRIYANLPLPIRDQVVLVLNKKLTATDEDIKMPISWNVAYLEVSQKTELSAHILEEMAGLELI